VGKIRLRIIDERRIGRMLPGDKARNPNLAENIKYIEAKPEARYKGNAKPGQVRNPYGCKGYAGAGLEKPMAYTKKELLTALEAREMVDLARQKARKAMQVYEDVIDAEAAADTAKIQAANAILDRAYGKATQTSVNTQVNADGKPTEIDDKELNRRIDEALKRVEAVARGEGQADHSEVGSPDLRKLN
jgi:hypothetical protein